MDNPVDNVDKHLFNQVKKQILGIFAKQPLPGQVKTRLSPPLSADQAAALYSVSLKETVTRMRRDDLYDLAICYSGDLHWFVENFPDMDLVPQLGEDLGARMAQQLCRWLGGDYERAILIGSDAPDLPQACIEQAFTALEQQPLVLGPALDGGYYLIGESIHHPELFSNIPWSSADVLPQTLARAAVMGINYALLPPWDDLDDLPALLRLVERSPDSSTAAQIKSVLSCWQATSTAP